MRFFSFALASAVAAGSGGARRQFTVYTPPIELRYGQVHNKRQEPSPLPKPIVDEFADGKSVLAISGFELDVIRTAGGAEVPVPLYDHYLHHYILHMGGAQGMLHLEYLARNKSSGLALMMPTPLLRLQARGEASDVSFGGASGAEFRHNPHQFEAPFRTILAQPTTWAPTIHLINLLPPDASSPRPSPSPLLQCPCTPQRVLNATDGTVDGRRPFPPFGHCSAAFDSNPSCSLKTYVGGWRCCDEGVFLTDTAACRLPGCAELPKSSVHLKFTFYFEAVDAATLQPSASVPAVRPMSGITCCDVTQDPSVALGNVEYDVPQCAEGTPPAECVQVTTNVQPLDFVINASRGYELVDLAFTAPHLHVSGISIELQDAITNESLCKVTRGDGVQYGHTEQAGDEKDYLTGLRPCVWNGRSAPRYQRRHPMRTIVVYNATTPQTGVMALWLSSAAPFEDKHACAAELDRAGCYGSGSCVACAAAAASVLGPAGCQHTTIDALCAADAHPTHAAR